jgi:hypothetical protein
VIPVVELSERLHRAEFVGREEYLMATELSVFGFRRLQLKKARSRRSRET